MSHPNTLRRVKRYYGDDVWSCLKGIAQDYDSLSGSDQEVQLRSAIDRSNTLHHSGLAPDALIEMDPQHTWFSPRKQSDGSPL